MLNYIRLLTDEEGQLFTESQKASRIPPGNLVNGNTEWNISGTLIQKTKYSENEILCNSRTLLIPVRYRTFQDAMAICEELGETGKMLMKYRGQQDLNKIIQEAFWLLLLL